MFIIVIPFDFNILAIVLVAPSLTVSVFIHLPVQIPDKFQAGIF